MGVKLLILLALLIGVLYSIHLLVKDYQAITAARNLLRFLFKRDLSSKNNTTGPHVRWRKILLHDPIQCARYFYCDLGTRPADTEIRSGFSMMLTLKPRDEDRSSHEVFKMAYDIGTHHGRERCKKEYSMCPFNASLLFELVNYLLKSH